ncbi:hypothetical protein EJB05_52817, partial [Eragrostis curvula]
MAGSEDQWRRHADRGDDELEEGEFVPRPRGYHSESDTEEYYNHYSSESDDEPTSRARSHSVPTNNGGDAGSSSVAANGNGYSSSSSAAAVPVLACRVCGKEFTSTKAVCGHQGSRSGGPMAPGTGERQEGEGEPKLVLDPTPLAYAASNLSLVSPVAPAKTDLSSEGSGAQSMHDDAMAVAVVAGADSPAEAVVHQQQAAPLPAGDEAARVHHQRAAPLTAGAQNPDGYTCGECGAWFKTHQALGGHVAGHKNRRLAAAGMDLQADVPCRRGSNKPRKRHLCRICSVEFPKGVQLGGHMRKHYTGEPIVPKKKQHLDEPVPPPPADVVVPQLDPADVDMADLSLALPVEAGDVKSPVATVEAVQPAPSPAVEGTSKPTLAPRVTGRVILFGIDIGLGGQKPTAQEGSPVTKEEGSPA